MTSAASLYSSVIQDVIANVRDAFQDEAVDESVLLELKTLWENKLAASRTIEQAPRAPPPAPAPAPNQPPQASNGSGGSILVADRNQLMPVQITIPAQPGQPNSVQKALTVQVPAHALQHGSPTSTILQQVLTQGITQALSIQDSTQAAFYLQAQINNALRINVSGNL